MTISKINGTIAKCRSVQLSRNNDSVYQTEVYFSILAKLETAKRYPFANVKMFWHMTWKIFAIWVSYVLGNCMSIFMISYVF